MCLHGHFQILTCAHTQARKFIWAQKNTKQVLTHTLTEGVRAICGPSHASPMQRCLLAEGVIIGHGGLFLCQGRPCQEMTDNRAQQRLARTAAAHVEPGRDEGMMANMCTCIINYSSGRPSFSLFTNDICLCSISSERVNRIEEVAHSEVKPHFSDLIS